jgi:hypothetical protein
MQRELICVLSCSWQKETTMADLRPWLLWVGILLGSIVTLSGCTYAAMQKLSLDEQVEFQKLFYKPLCQSFQ